MRIFVGKGYVGVTGRGRSSGCWMQDRNLKEENCFESKNITNPFFTFIPCILIL